MKTLADAQNMTKNQIKSLYRAARLIKRGRVDELVTLAEEVGGAIITRWLDGETARLDYSIDGVYASGGWRFLRGRRQEDQDRYGESTLPLP